MQIHGSRDSLPEDVAEWHAAEQEGDHENYHEEEMRLGCAERPAGRHVIQQRRQLQINQIQYK